MTTQPPGTAALRLRLEAKPLRTAANFSFFSNSTAANGTFVIEGAAVSGAGAGFASFEFGGTAGNGVFIVNGGSTAHAVGEDLIFLGTSGGNPTAGHAT